MYLIGHTTYDPEVIEIMKLAALAEIGFDSFMILIGGGIILAVPFTIAFYLLSFLFLEEQLNILKRLFLSYIEFLLSTEELK